MAANKEDEPEHIQRIIERLGLVPHPEGGYFVETLRAGCAPMQSRGYTDLSGEVIQTDVGPRNSCTVIYYLLTKKTPIQYMIRNKSLLVHTFHEGSPATYYSLEDSGAITATRFGPQSDTASPQYILRGPCTKAAELEEGGDYCLLSEVVTPGFDVNDCHMLSLPEVQAKCPEWKSIAHLVHRAAVLEVNEGSAGTAQLYGQFYTHLDTDTP